MENILQEYGRAILCCAAIILSYVVWILFFKPFNLVKDYTEFGYDIKNGIPSGRTKKSMVNLALKRRKIGELPPAYPNSWYAILESNDLLCGQVKEVFALGQNLVAWRGENNGKVYVSNAYCPHLGANLGVGGVVEDNCITCPFHKWKFNGSSGRVENIPYAKGETALEKLKGLVVWQVVETNGFVYVWYHSQGEEPTWYPESIDNICSGRWKYHGRSEFLVTCHIQEIPENGADIAHLNSLHDTPAIFDGKLSKFNSSLHKLAKHVWSANWSVSHSVNRKHESVVNISHHISLFNKMIEFFHVDVVVRQIGAGIVVMNFITPFGQGILLQSVTPIEPMLQRIIHMFYSEPKFIHPFALLVLHGEAVQISRDIAIWNRKCFLRKPMLVKEDATIKTFRRWFSQFYSTESQQQLHNNE